MATGVRAAVERLYDEDWRQQRIVMDIKNVHKAYRTLLPVEDSFVNNDGTVSRLVLLRGTVPITYRGGRYNIPLEVWLPHEYPKCPPVCYVRPVPGMAIPDAHPSVEKCGNCQIPYLRKWTPTSKLVMLFNRMCEEFGERTPVYALRTAEASTSPSHSPSPSPTPSPTSSSSSLYPSMDSSPADSAQYPDYSGAPSPPVPSTSPNATGSAGASPASSSDARSRLEYQAWLRLECMRTYILKVRAEQQADQQSLREHSSFLDECRTELDELNASIASASARAMAWVEQERESLRQLEAESPPAQDVVLFHDIIAQQHARVVAEDMAYEDTSYSIKKAFERGVISFDDYVRIVRQMHRDQFTSRALTVKIERLRASSSE